ncbi:hypothetical protein HF086_008784 [Spodoptera exigua]|uniref:Peptidase S1 domain-containing protein n=1 Tax=Spodoptera exigua TaxID=7107 RepID=A0A922SHT1_SPOEX|nr:hypothetical protein HF086_008784 [Spodoptera exigua]
MGMFLDNHTTYVNGNMKLLAVTLLALAVAATARHITLEDVIELEKITPYGYITAISLPLGDEVRIAEEEGRPSSSRIVGGSLADLGQFPYQAGLILHHPSRSGLASASLISNNRILTAAHNLNDGFSNVPSVTVVLGTTTLMSGGVRQTTSDYILHENYDISVVRSDIAIINLPSPVEFSIGGVLPNQPFSYVDLPVITNDECAVTFGTYIQPGIICTGSVVGKNICSGDSGGPLALQRNGNPFLLEHHPIIAWEARATVSANPLRYLPPTANMQLSNSIHKKTDLEDQKFFLRAILLALAVSSSGRHITLEDVIDFEDNPAFGYHTKIGIPLADKIRKLEEENPSRIIGGSLVNLEKVPYQRRVLTAAHNLNDAVSSATKLTVVLGTINIFIAGIRLDTEEFTLHENYNAATLRNDIAVINLPYYIAFSETVGPAYLPTESMEEEDFDGETAIVSGYGHTSSTLEFHAFPKKNAIFPVRYYNIIADQGSNGR